jgi:hypothetical protein
VANELQGKKIAILLTSYPTLQTDIRNAGGQLGG